MGLMIVPRLHNLQPLNLYAKSKNMFDQWVLGEIADGQPAPPSWAGLKFFNVYGPGKPTRAAWPV